MKNDSVTLHLIVQLILEYRTSLKTMSEILNISEGELYNNLMEIKDRRVKEILSYILNYETREPGLIDQKAAKLKVFSVLTKIHFAKTVEEKTEIIKKLGDNSEVFKLQGKRYDELSKEDFDRIINYRLKYAFSRLEIERRFSVSESVLINRENKSDEKTKKRLTLLNEYNDFKSYVKSKPSSQPTKPRIK